jgi:hypothetical protein
MGVGGSIQGKDSTMTSNHQPIDAALVELVHQVEKAPVRANGKPAGFGITVQTSGGLFSGMLVSRSTWATRTLDAVEDQDDEFRALARGVTEAAESFDVDTIQFIHFTKARYVAGSFTTGEMFPLRVRLQDVTAWSIGVVSNSDDDVDEAKDDETPGA